MFLVSKLAGAYDVRARMCVCAWDYNAHTRVARTNQLYAFYILSVVLLNSWLLQLNVYVWVSVARKLICRLFDTVVLTAVSHYITLLPPRHTHTHIYAQRQRKSTNVSHFERCALNFYSFFFFSLKTRSAEQHPTSPRNRNNHNRSN